MSQLTKFRNKRALWQGGVSTLPERVVNRVRSCMNLNVWSATPVWPSLPTLRKICIQNPGLAVTTARLATGMPGTSSKILIWVNARWITILPEILMYFSALIKILSVWTFFNNCEYINMTVCREYYKYPSNTNHKMHFIIITVLTSFPKMHNTWGLSLNTQKQYGVF